MAEIESKIAKDEENKKNIEKELKGKDFPAKLAALNAKMKSLTTEIDGLEKKKGDIEDDQDAINNYRNKKASMPPNMLFRCNHQHYW